MNECKNCGAQIAEGEELCTACAQQADSVETPVSEPAVQAAETETPVKKPVSEKTKRLRTQLGLGALLIVAAVAVCLVVYFTQGRPHVEPNATDTTAADTTVTDTTVTTTETVEYVSFTKDLSEVTDADKNAVVATCAGVELTNQTLSYYYWYAYNTYYSYLSYYGLVSDSLPLDQQGCTFNSAISWQEYFINAGIDAFTQFTLLNKSAAEDGFVLPEESQTALDTLEETLQTSADNYGYESVNAYLQDYYGAFADFESYYAFMETYYIALGYDDQNYYGFTFTNEEIEAYYEEHADEFSVEKDDTLMINVRHILIQPVSVDDVLDADGNVDETATAAASAAAWEAARAEAEAVYAEWLDGDATEESFANLAYLRSEDGGSYTNGGLYEDVYPGEMVTEFNDWCFDPARQPGDTDIVETTYGFHLMYFVDYCETSYWGSVVSEAMVSEAYNAFYENIMAADDTVAQTENAVLLDPPAMSATEAE